MISAEEGFVTSLTYFLLGIKLETNVFKKTYFVVHISPSSSSVTIGEIGGVEKKVTVVVGL